MHELKIIRINSNQFLKKYSNFYSDDWGEQYVGKCQSVIVVFDLKSTELKVLDTIPNDYSPAQVKLTSYLFDY